MFDQLLTHACVATMEGTAPFGLVERGAIAIDGAAIAWVGPLEALPSREAGAVHDLGGRLVTPGLVDPHTHLVYGEEGFGDFEILSQGGGRWDLEPAGAGVGGLVARTRALSEEALYAACRDGAIGGAVIDTWYRYPDPSGGRGGPCLPSRLPFETLGNVVMTPHASGWSAGLLERRWTVIADNLLRLERGEPLLNLLRPPAGVSPAAGAP